MAGLGLELRAPGINSDYKPVLHASDCTDRPSAVPRAFNKYSHKQCYNPTFL